MKDADAPPSLGWVGRGLDDESRLLRALDSRHHHSHRTCVEGTRNQVVLGVGHADNGHDTVRPSACRQHADHLQPDAGVFLVEDDELGARIDSKPGDTGRGELVDEGAEDGPPSESRRFTGFSIMPSPGRPPRTHPYRTGGAALPWRASSRTSWRGPSA